MQQLKEARARIGWVCPYLPWPQNSGGRLRIHHLARGLASDELLLFAFPSPDDPDPRTVAQDDRRFPWAACHLFQADEQRQNRELFTPASATRTPAELNQALLAAHAERPLDAVIIEHCYAAGGLTWPAGVPALLDEHNIESDYHRQRAEQARSPRLAIEYLGWRRFERRVWQRVSGVAVVCEKDARAVARVRRAPACIAENAVDARRYTFRPPSQRRGNQILLAGHLSYEPNVRAALYLAEQVLPRLARLVPEASLVLAGRCPMAEVRALAGPRVQVLADVESIESLYDSSAACALPITLGAGTSLKVLEVLQTGVPLVATAFAVRGFGLRAGSHYLRAENPEEFAHALAAVLRERARFDELAQTGYAHSCALTWERSAERFASWVHTEIHQSRPRSTSSLTVR